MMRAGILIISALTFFCFYPTVIQAQHPAPVYLSLKPSPHEFDLFANGGWDGNWYIGSNSAWIVGLEAPPNNQNFVRAYIGAKMGRMKSQPVSGQAPWIRSVSPCNIYMGIASTSAWRPSDSYYLVNCEDLPVEPNNDDALSGVGESRWYWREVPISKINFGGDNYLAIWSTTVELVDASTAPILAAAKVHGAAKAWLNRGVRGAPPQRAEDALESNLSEFAPGLAIKLIAGHDFHPVEIEMMNFKENPEGYFWEVQAAGRNMDRVELEISADGDRWLAFGRPVFDPPYYLTMTRDRIQREVANLVPGNRKPNQIFCRITARDEWGNHASTDSFAIYVRPN
ncbi:MAG: hypothetical protein HY547_02940 [Elusimicrobia bacterium]|nr:hypothetical protein [Elusimicrobiota bacterium]